MDDSVSGMSSSSEGPSAAGCSSSSSCSESRPWRPVVSLLERLRVPTVSELSRKRRIDANPPPPAGKKRSTQTVRKFDPQSVRPSQRANEFPGEQLVESAGKLFCRACRENVAVKRSNLRSTKRAKKSSRKKSPGKGTLHKHSELKMPRRTERVRLCLKNTMSIELKL